MEQLKETVKVLGKRKDWTQEDLARVIRVTVSAAKRQVKKGGEPPYLSGRC